MDRPESKAALHIGVAAWGNEFVSLFADMTIASLLAPGNIPSLARHCDIVLHIVTDEEGDAFLKNHPGLGRIGQFVEILISRLDYFDRDASQRYNVASMCHVLLLEKARQAGAPLVLTCPDHVYADGSFLRFLRYIGSSKTLIMVGSLRVTTDSFLPMIEEHVKDGVISVPPRQLVALAMEHLHPFNKANFWDASGIRSNTPANLFWRSEEEGFIARAFHLHPIMIVPPEEKRINVAIDVDYINDWPINEVEVITDSDDFFFAEFTPYYNMLELIIDRELLITEVINWAKGNCNIVHVFNFLHTLVFRTGEVNTLHWAVALARSEVISKEILKLLKAYSK